MKYNPNKHHRKSIRLKGFDYAKANLFFITINCDKRAHYFGKIENQKMILNEAGMIANHCWLEIPLHFPNVILHEYMIMPNHIHGIIEITENNHSEDQLNYPPRQNAYQKIIPNSIGSIVKGFKIGVTKWFRINTNIETVWQKNYYEHIIRNEQAYENISKYIINNPMNWEQKPVSPEHS